MLMLHLKGRLGMPLRIRWYNLALFPSQSFNLKYVQHQLHSYGTYRGQKLHHGITWLSTNAQPILYPIHAPFDSLVRAFGFDSRSVNAQKLNWFRVPPLSLVDGDEVEDSVVSDAVHGESQTDGHDGRIDLVRDHVSVASEESIKYQIPKRQCYPSTPWVCRP